MKMMDGHEIVKFISESEKSTPVKVYLNGDVSNSNFGEGAKVYPNEKGAVVFGEWKAVQAALNEAKIEDYVVENDRRNSAIPLLDMKNIKARIEPGAIIRDQVEIGDNAVIMMGASINIGSVVGEGTMIDMTLLWVDELQLVRTVISERVLY